MRTEYMLEQQVELVLQLLTPANRAVLRTALHTGLRIGDVLALKPDQLKPNFWVTEQKTKKRRQVGLPAPLLCDLQEMAGTWWVFPGASPRKHRTRQAVWKDMKRAALAARFPQNCAPHSFRKVYAVQLLQKYGDMARVQKALNHRSQEVTMLYALADHMLSHPAQKRRQSPGRTRA